MSAGPAPNPLAGRQRALLVFLRVALGATAGCALVAVVAGDTAGRVMVSLLVAIPIVRIAWLVTRWSGRRDWRFAAAGLVLLAVMVTGSVLAR